MQQWSPFDLRWFSVRYLSQQCGQEKEEAGGRGRVSLSGWFHSKIMLAKSPWARCWVRIGYSWVFVMHLSGCQESSRVKNSSTTIDVLSSSLMVPTLTSETILHGRLPKLPHDLWVRRSVAYLDDHEPACILGICSKIRVRLAIELKVNLRSIALSQIQQNIQLLWAAATQFPLIPPGKSPPCTKSVTNLINPWEILTHEWELSLCTDTILIPTPYLPCR